MKTKETWIDETINSLDGIKRADADPGLFLKIQAKSNQPCTSRALFMRQVPWSVAAGIAILITLNVFTILFYNNLQTNSQEVPAALASDYLSYLWPIKL